MARGINKAIIVGTLGNDPEVKQLPSGSMVANLSVATHESWKDKSSGEMIEKTEWHRVVVYGRLAEICGQYLRKGSQAYFEGKLQTRKWTDQNNQDRYTTEIVANEMQMLGGRGDAVGDTARTPAPAQNPASGQSQAQASSPSQAQAQSQSVDPFDADDVPF